MNNICFNGKFLPAGQPVFSAENRGYRFGDGLFETMKVHKGIILLESYHFQRLFESIGLLKMKTPAFFSTPKIESDIQELCRKNNCTDRARVRLSVSRGDGGLYQNDEKLQCLIECWPLDESANQFNENGFTIDVFTNAIKSADSFSHLKSASFLPYVMAAQYAKENKLNDCLLLNQFGRIADASIANLFVVSNGKIITPPLSEGCINGVMRKYLLNRLAGAGYTLEERPVTIAEIENADELFLTNAIKGLHWVAQFRNKVYTNQYGLEIYRQFIQTLF